MECHALFFSNNRDHGKKMVYARLNFSSKEFYAGFVCSKVGKKLMKVGGLLINKNSYTLVSMQLKLLSLQGQYSVKCRSGPGCSKHR